jgi:formiminotetrahydrofolate cyclodeaminase
MTDSCKDLSLGSFLEQLASASPTPGGGSIAALSGALSASLILMACNLAARKEESTQYKQDLNRLKKETTRLQSVLIDAVDKDMKSYQAVLACYRLPRKTDAHRAKRTEALQAALVQAVEIPYDIAVRCNRLLVLCESLAKIAKPNTISDIAVATYLADAAVQSALCNVEINCKQITDAEFVHRHHGLSNTLSEQATTRKEEVLKIVEAILSK